MKQLFRLPLFMLLMAVLAAKAVAQDSANATAAQPDSPAIFARKIPEKTLQLPNGRIILPAPEATTRDGATRPSQGSEHWIEIRPGAEGRLLWTYKPTRWGMYDVQVFYATEDAAKLEVEIGGTKFQGEFAATGGAEKYRVQTVGKYYVPDEKPFNVELRHSGGANSAPVNVKAVLLIPAPEGKPIVQTGDSIELHSRDAIVHGVTLRYEPATNKNCLGYWMNPKDNAEWKFEVTEPGTYEIELWQGCGKDQGGSDVAVEVTRDGKPIKQTEFVVEETGHFQKFVPRKLGRVTFDAKGEYSLFVRPQRKQAFAIMDIRVVKLLPVQEEANAADGAKLNSILGKKVLFLGDSITYSGEYIEYLEAAIRLSHPAASIHFLNLGLPSETVSGLSEPGHAGGQFPRPDLHERLDRVLGAIKPDLVFACYGMNDGIYYPFSEDRFEKFQSGIRRLRNRAEQIGAEVIHLTPPTFDPLPLKGRTLPAGRDEYRVPFDGYNDVLGRYSKWLVDQRKEGWKVIDIHAAMDQFLAARRKREPDFILAGDGVHANPQGHWLITREILRYLGAPDSLISEENPSALSQAGPNASQVLKLTQQRQRILKDAWLTHTGHLRPGMNKGKPLEEAQAKAEGIAKELRDALKPI